MLLPSALPCDQSHQHQQRQSTPRTRLQAALLASPPASPPALPHQGAIGDIFNTCRSLQTLLATPPSGPVDPAPATQQMPTPPLAHAPPPLKLRLRPRPTKPDGPGDHLPRKKIIKRAPPRGANKRRRTPNDDRHLHLDHHDEDSSDSSQSDGEPSSPLPRQYPTEPDMPSAPATPKRARIAPEVIPLGLERSDYHNLHLLELSSRSNGDHNNTNGNNRGYGPDGRNMTREGEPQGTNVEVEADGEPWSVEDDRLLVELVLEKLKLTKTEWQDCARSLGKDRSALSRRWKSLMAKNEVGLKGSRATRRSRIHATWR